MAQRWIVSPAVDLAALALPAAATVAVLLAPRPDELSLLHFLWLVVAFDVAHVWATVYLTYGDAEVRRRRPLLLVLPIPLVWVAAFRLHEHSPSLYWTVLAYVAIHHFASQQYGFVALYRALGGAATALDRSLDKVTLWTGALVPVIAWHASPAGFDWFGHGEAFLAPLDPALLPDLYAVYGAVALAYLGRQVWHATQGSFNLPKNAWMLASWVSWAVGLAWADHPLVALAAINLMHGLPFLGLVWVRARRRWAAEPEARGVVPWLVRNPWSFVAPLLAVALLEEGLWEGLVWGHYVALWTELSPTETSLVVAVLALPQTVHYVLDGWIWKMDGSNPDLKLLFAGPPGPQPA
ncbi:MAG: hypothetical protein KDD82_29080 [Planctomycetes bacterium]|nr:hypothetical protein [Planctomycetota bacterium]